MKKPVWISYDLSVKGDYEGLYTWLDDHEAKECGDSMAFFLWDDTGTGDIQSQVKEVLLKSFSYGRKDRIYIICEKDKEGKKTFNGKFILGKRKTNPWTGFGSSEEEEEEEEYY
jgi:hypothetical protein